MQGAPSVATVFRSRGASGCFFILQFLSLFSVCYFQQEFVFTMTLSMVITPKKTTQPHHGNDRDLERLALFSQLFVKHLERFAILNRIERRPHQRRHLTTIESPQLRQARDQRLTALLAHARHRLNNLVLFAPIRIAINHLFDACIQESNLFVEGSDDFFDALYNPSIPSC